MISIETQIQTLQSDSLNIIIMRGSMGR